MGDVGIFAFLGALGAGLVGYALLERSKAQAAEESAPRPPRWRAIPHRLPEISTVPSRAPVPSTESAPTPEAVPIFEPPVLSPAPTSEPRGEADGSPFDPALAPRSIRPPTLDEWGVLIAPGCVSSGIQLAYALQWVAMESGGNPCAVGYPSSKGPDGAPREMGIAQFYNPDDLARLGLTSAELRAYCVPGDQHEVMFRGKKIRGFSGKLARALTREEMIRQADGTVGLISRSRTRVTQVLTSIGAGAAWSPTRRDFWRLVKLDHGLPALISEGLVRINARLGRPPRDWSEFKRGLDTVTLGARAEEKRRQGLFPSVLENAERCASAFEERSVG